jgi:threonine efflux protein
MLTQSQMGRFAMDTFFTLTTIAAVFFVGLVSPGPNFIVVTSTAMSSSRKAGLMAAAGLACASLTWTILSIFGLGVVLHQFPWVYTAVKAIGAAYLIWLGLKMLVAKTPSQGGNMPIAATPEQAFLKAYGVSLTNPKSAAFFASAFAALIPSSAPIWLYTAIALIVFSLSMAWHGLLALGFSTQTVREKFTSYERCLNVVFGTFLTVLGVRLLASR